MLARLFLSSTTTVKPHDSDKQTRLEAQQLQRWFRDDRFCLRLVSNRGKLGTKGKGEMGGLYAWCAEDVMIGKLEAGFRQMCPAGYKGGCRMAGYGLSSNSYIIKQKGLSSTI